MLKALRMPFPVSLTPAYRRTGTPDRRLPSLRLQLLQNYRLRLYLGLRLNAISFGYLLRLQSPCRDHYYPGSAGTVSLHPIYHIIYRQQSFCNKPTVNVLVVSRSDVLKHSPLKRKPCIRFAPASPFILSHINALNEKKGKNAP